MSSNEKESNDFTFKKCVVEVKRIFEIDNQDIDNITKYNNITKVLQKYYANEDIRDVFEGFLRLFIEFQQFSSSIDDRHDDSLAIQAMQAFELFKTQCDPFEQDIIAESMPNDKYVFLNALKAASFLKQKHLTKVISIFRLNEPKKANITTKLIKHILKKDVLKAVEWIIILDVRDMFANVFNDVVCHLFLLNQKTLLEMFIGDQQYRKLNFVKYIDEVFLLELKQLQGRNKLEELVLNDVKRLEKLIARFMKLHDIPKTKAPNVLCYRSKSALFFHHFRWANNEMTLTNFEEIALHAMKESPFICRFYLNFLCTRNLHKNAVYFAFRLQLPFSEFPRLLSVFCSQNFDEVQSAKEKAENEIKLKKSVVANRHSQDCELYDGTPVYLITDWRSIQRVMKLLKNEQVIGIDTEWKPHFVSFKEQVALIQVACSKAVFLVDVVVLEKRLGCEQWLEFFRVLFCSEDCRKIGFDFCNDLRVLKSTFPFLSVLASEIKHVICMYKLMQQILILPDAECLVFPDGKKMRNLNLYDIAKFFLNIELDKSEQNSNWMERPMRPEKKIYAALDAYCLTNCFNLIAKRLAKLNDSTVLKQLHCASIVNFVEAKISTTPCIYRDLNTGEYIKNRKLNEDDSEFIECILKTTADIKAKAPAKKKDAAVCFKSAGDFFFAMDSMLFGLGKNLRKCGFKTELVKERKNLVKFCIENPKYIAVSTGRGFKQLETQLPSNQILCVPVNTNDAHLNSQLVTYIMRRLNIIINPEDMRSRCVNCNNRAFMRLSRFIVKTIYYIYAVQKNFEWLTIGQEELQKTLIELAEHSITKDSLKISEELDLQSDEEYTLTIHENQITCKCRHCSVDIINRQILSTEFPVEIGAMLHIKKEIFDDSDACFYICGSCGKVQLSRLPKNILNEGVEQKLDNLHVC